MFLKTKNDLNGSTATLDVVSLLYTAEVAAGLLVQKIAKQADDMLRNPQKINGLGVDWLEGDVAKLCTVAETLHALRGATSPMSNGEIKNIEFVRG